MENYNIIADCLRLAYNTVYKERKIARVVKSTVTPMTSRRVFMMNKVIRRNFNNSNIVTDHSNSSMVVRRPSRFSGHGFGGSRRIYSMQMNHSKAMNHSNRFHQPRLRIHSNNSYFQRHPTNRKIRPNHMVRGRKGSGFGRPFHQEGAVSCFEIRSEENQKIMHLVQFWVEGMIMLLTGKKSQGNRK